MRKDHDHPRHPFGFLVALLVLAALAYPMVAEWLAFTKLADAHVPNTASEVRCVPERPAHRCQAWRASEPSERLGADYRITIERGSRALVSVIRFPWVRLDRAHVLEAKGCVDDANDPEALLCPLGDPVVLESGRARESSDQYSNVPSLNVDPWNSLSIR